MATNRKSFLKRVLSALAFRKSSPPKKKEVPPSVRDIIRKAAQNLQMVEIVYPDKSGASVPRVTEPYEFKNGSYFGYDVQKNGIRHYKIDKIQSAKVLDQKFVPRWPVKIQ